MTEIPHPDGLRYQTDVQARWSDLDVFGHVNNARVLTLLEEARVAWLFIAARESGVRRLVDGVVVAHVTAAYRRPIGFEAPVTVSMWVAELRSASFTIGYDVTADGQLAVQASTVMAPVDPATFKPRRLDTAESDYFRRFLPTAR